jgi:hypothetical protein
MDEDEPSLPTDHRVIGFRRPVVTPRAACGSPSLPDLGKYEHNEEEHDDYRHRMMVNAGAFLFIVLLIGAALWLVDTMAEMRKNQDCVLAGHRGCTPIDLGTSQR